MLFFNPLIDSTITPAGYAVSQQNDFRFTVRFSINGKRWSLCGIQDFETACRFADMFVLRFRKYLRVDAIRWNFSEAQAVADTADDSERGGNLANFFLARSERELAGVLVERTRTDEPRTAKPAQVNRLDVLEACNAKLEQRIGDLEKQIEEIKRQIGPGLQ